MNIGRVLDNIRTELRDRQTKIEETFKFIRDIKGDKKCGDHAILQNPNTGELILRISRKTDDREQAKTLFQRYHSRMQASCPAILRCIDFSMKHENAWCSNFFYFNVYFEYPFHDLESEMKRKLQDRVRFTHEELTEIFYQALDGLCFFQNEMNGHGKLQAFSIFFDENNRMFKVSEYFLGMARGEYFKFLYLEKGGIKIFAPELVEFLQRRSIVIDDSKLDMFHLGLILLALGLCNDLSCLYDRTKFSMNLEELKKLILSFKDIYEAQNPLLVSIVEGLLVVDPSKRALPIETRKMIPSHYSFIQVISKNLVQSENEFH